MEGKKKEKMQFAEGSAIWYVSPTDQDSLPYLYLQSLFAEVYEILICKTAPEQVIVGDIKIIF